MKKLVKRADVIYPGHDRPFRFVNGDVQYLAAFDMTMFGADPSTPGLKFGAPPILTTIDLTDGEPVGPRWTKEELRRPPGTAEPAHMPTINMRDVARRAGSRSARSPTLSTTRNVSPAAVFAASKTPLKNSASSKEPRQPPASTRA